MTDEAMAARLAQLEAQLAALTNGGPRKASLDAPLTTYPEGSRPMDFRPVRVRAREKAIAKMRAIARTRGGEWSDRAPSVYGHRVGDDMTPGCENDEFKVSCHRTCWTPETEVRFLHALGLKDLAEGRELIPLTPPDPKDKDALRELVGLLKGNATTADVAGRYPERPPTRDEVGTARGVQIRKVSSAA